MSEAVARHPAGEAPLFAVCYDLGSDRERRLVERIVSGFGFRVQYSVFECRLTPGALRKLQSQLDKLLLRSGHVRLYRVYSGQALRTSGKRPPSADDEHAYTVELPVEKAPRRRAAKPSPRARPTRPPRHRQPGPETSE